MTKKETIYNALGMIEGAVCVSQKNTREVLMKAIEMIKNAIEEDADCKPICNHEWEATGTFEYGVNEASNGYQAMRYVCRLCGATDYRKI